jgi:ATP-dependent helicase/DNAse subunit B
MNHSGQFELITGPAGDYYYFQKEISERITKRQNPLEFDFVYFLPVKRAVRSLREKLIASASQKVLATPPIFTFYDFMVSLYQQLPQAKKVISAAMRLFLIEESVKACAGELQFLREDSAERRGLVAKIEALISELREYGYDDNTLLRHVENHGDPRYQDFAKILAAYQKALTNKLIDETGAIHEVLHQLETKPQLFKKFYPKINTIYFSGYGLYSEPMVRFIGLMSRQLNVIVKLDYVHQNQSMFAHTKEAYDRLKALNPIEKNRNKPDDWEILLFSKQSFEGKMSLNKEVLIQPCRDRQQEVAFIAAYVKRLHLEKNIPLHKIGITFPSLEQYAPLIHEIFPKYGLPETGLPYNLSTGFQLSQSPLIRSFMLLLEIPLFGFDANKIEQLLEMPFLSPELRKRIPPEIVYNVASELRMTRLAGDICSKIGKHITYLNQQKGLVVDDTYTQRDLDQRVKLLKQHAEDFCKLLEWVSEINKKQSVSEFRRGYLELLDRLGFLKWYRTENPYMTPTEKEKEFRAFNRFIKLLDQFNWIVATLHGDELLTLKDLYGYLNLLISQATYNLREWSNFGLQIMPRLEILAIEPQVLIFGGMVEGDFPRPFAKDAFFSDDERAEMNLAASEDLLDQDKFLFYQVLSSRLERLVFTFPRFQGEAATVPSTFLTVLKDQTEVHCRKKMPSELFLQTETDLLINTARGIRNQQQNASKLQLKRWYMLNRSFSGKVAMAELWLQKMKVQQQKLGDVFTPYEGMLNVFPEIVDKIAQITIRKPLSITRLESYAFCPIQFFLNYVLELSEREDVQTEMTALERGQYVHHTLFQFYVELRKKGLIKEAPSQGGLLRETAEKEFKKFPFSGLLYELEFLRFFGNGTNRQGLWQKYLEKEASYMSDDKATLFEPAFFEVAFGDVGAQSTRDPKLLDLPPVKMSDGTISFELTGKIDRIDLDQNGNALLLDYKTGNINGSAIGNVLKGLVLQLPVYADVLNDILSDYINRPVAMTLYQVKDEFTCKRKNLMSDNITLPGGGRDYRLPCKNSQEKSFDEVLNEVRDFLFGYVGQIRSGNFRHTAYPKDDACAKYCQFRYMCRKDTGKILRVKGEKREEED